MKREVAELFLKKEIRGFSIFDIEKAFSYYAKWVLRPLLKNVLKTKTL